MPHAYYVTARSGKSAVAVLAGPFTSNEQAESFVDPARRLVDDRYRHDIEAGFASFGTARIPLTPGKPVIVGKLNDQLGWRPTR